MNERLRPSPKSSLASTSKMSGIGRVSSLLGLALVALTIGPPTAAAQSYTLDWHRIFPAYGESTGGSYSLSSAISQENSSLPLTGGAYSLSGGLWIAPAPGQTLDLPALQIQVTSANTALICWPAASTGYVLQESTSLSPANWTTVSAPPTSDGTANIITIKLSAEARFYRLLKVP